MSLFRLVSLLSCNTKHKLLGLPPRALCHNLPKETKESTENPSSLFRRDSIGFNASKFDRHLLVSTGVYKSMKDVPKLVSHASVEKARNYYRVRGMLYMMVVAAFGFIFMAYLGKQDAKKNITVQSMNRDFHANYRKEYNEKHGEKEK